MVGQTRDEAGPVEVALDAGAPLPESWNDLGRALRSLRDGGRRSLREVADQANISKSALGRYEHGAPMQMVVASSLDVALSAEGWIAASAARLIQPRWSPWIDHRSARHHAHRWPAPYGGQVWVRLVPAPQDAKEEHVVNLSWGPWRREVIVDLPVRGLALVTGKAPDDGESVTFEVKSNRPVFALFGLGDLETEPVLDIHSGWYR